MMVHHHELENLSEFVLHELCTGPCFNVHKAAYFINNLDFNIMRGVSGYNHQEEHARMHDRWQRQDHFTTSMQNSLFNQKIRSYTQLTAFQPGQSSERYVVDKLADHLEIAQPSYHVWNLKHANHGLLIYEPLVHDVAGTHSHVMDALYYLSFCPIF
jgi:hypothetical protein